MKTIYQASKSKSQNRPGWSISFRHPLLKDSSGKIGRKIRRGLGTNEEAQADILVAQMNELLGNQAWWNYLKKAEAENTFDKVVVNAFFDDLHIGIPLPETLREAEIPLPTVEDGYARVLFVGTTGAGKTSLLRQFIGSDPEQDRFPSTAPAKTTIADLEVIQSEGDCHAVVTFFSEFQVRAYIEECILAAALAAFDKASEEKIADKFLNHSDQKFRLSYVLGNWPSSDDADEISFDTDENQDESEDMTVNPFFERLQSLVAKIQKIATLAESQLRAELEDTYDDYAIKYKEDLESEFDRYILEIDGDCASMFMELTDEVITEIQQRFDAIITGKLNRTASGWPETWVFKTSDRDQFIREVRWFSSNYWREFGQLLTPIVQGIRVKAPLYPIFSDQKTKLILIDGQGLGHTPDSATSVPTEITKKFSTVDMILLVDNAQQPMLAAPQSLLRSVASSGFHHKLAIAFTHFDLIKGDNLKTLDDKKNHVMSSVVQSIVSLRDVIGIPVAKAVESSLYERCVMLGGIDKRTDRLPKSAGEYVKKQLLNLIEIAEQSIAPLKPIECAPIYDPSGIGFAVRDAVLKFIEPWSARLGLGSYNGISKEHYNRIKALNRRIAGELDIEYNSLRPVADLITKLTESISTFLDKPNGWTRTPETDMEAEAAISQVRRYVSSELYQLAYSRIIENQRVDWRNALDLNGKGSAQRRAFALKVIYEWAAPTPDTIMTPEASEFMSKVREIIESSVQKAGGHMSLK